ncbi:uncharacterized protein LOC123020288 isoform X2 [Varanus komodoensis]|nr:uncharacterized protein LOC123020288 isoform X2 [Varanus komodoensis]
MSTQEARIATAASTKTPTASSKEAVNSITLNNSSANWNTLATDVNTTNFSPLSSNTIQTTYSLHKEANSSSAMTAETKTVVTRVPTVSFFGNSTYQATAEESNGTPGITLKLTSQPFRSTPVMSSKVLLSDSAKQFPEGAHLKKSEVILTIGFAIVLTLTILGFTVYILNKHRKRRDQYSHCPLHDASSETVDRYATPDDTLVISGGLYDAPRFYNPNMMVYEDDELQNDNLSFTAQHGQLEMDLSPIHEAFQIPAGAL